MPRGRQGSRQQKAKDTVAERIKFPVRVGLLGCGTVGGGVIQLIQENAEYLASRVGAPLEIRHVLVRDAEKDRVPGCKKEWLTTEPDVVLAEDAVDIVIEVMGERNPPRPTSNARWLQGKAS